MARAPLLQISDASLTFGGRPTLDGASLAVGEGDRIALVGRNGSGKSTLLKVMAGLIEPDSGLRATAPGATVGYLEQEPDLSGYATLGDYAASGLAPGEEWRVGMAAEGLGLDPDREAATASGGERRRAALARILATDPDLLLLDEPTNHLDVAAIGWLEERLRDAKAVVLVSHDRAVLRAVSKSTLWLDRGSLRRLDEGFEGFEAWRDRVWEQEDEARHKLDRLIKAEAKWAVEGISARRKRNQGRVRALAGLREERASQIRRQGAAALALDAGPTSGKRVIVAKGLEKTFEGRPIVKGLDLTVQRGDRLAIVGPNGAGKTTLVNLLLKRLEPDAGSVTHGTSLEVAVLEQSRDALDGDLTLWDALTQDPALRSPGRSDQVMVRGEPRHVVGYLKDFLFGEDQARAPLRSLSGGERARLLLARIMARPSNVLVLDEPTNDLDVETLDLLQEVLDGYDGTAIVVSHDRDFLDRVATVTVAMEGDGTAIPYAGGWTDMMAQRGGKPLVRPAEAPATPVAKAAVQERPREKAAAKLSFTERHRLDALPAEIDRLTGEVGKLAALLGDADLYAREPAKFQKASALLAERQAALSAAEEEWLLLAERAEG